MINIIYLPIEMLDYIFWHLSAELLSVISLSSHEHVSSLASSISQKKIRQRETLELDKLALKIIKLVGSPMNLGPQKARDILVISGAPRFFFLRERYGGYDNLNDYLELINDIYKYTGDILINEWQGDDFEIIVDAIERYWLRYTLVANALRDNPFG